MVITEEKNAEIIEQIKTAMDGRSQRWLSLEAAIPEADLSKKMNNKMNFSVDELEKIAARLNFVIEGIAD